MSRTSEKLVANDPSSKGGNQKRTNCRLSLQMIGGYLLTTTHDTPTPAGQAAAGQVRRETVIDFTLSVQKTLFFAALQ